jgi:hypothetical protein
MVPPLKRPCGNPALALERASHQLAAREGLKADHWRQYRFSRAYRAKNAARPRKRESLAWRRRSGP